LPSPIALKLTNPMESISKQQHFPIDQVNCSPRRSSAGSPYGIPMVPSVPAVMYRPRLRPPVSPSFSSNLTQIVI